MNGVSPAVNDAVRLDIDAGVARLWLDRPDRANVVGPDFARGLAGDEWSVMAIFPRSHSTRHS